MNISNYFLFADVFSAILDTAVWGQKSRQLGWFLVHWKTAKNLTDHTKAISPYIFRWLRLFLAGMKACNWCRLVEKPSWFAFPALPRVHVVPLEWFHRMPPRNLKLNWPPLLGNKQLTLILKDKCAAWRCKGVAHSGQTTWLSLVTASVRQRIWQLCMLSHLEQKSATLWVSKPHVQACVHR